MKYINIYSDIVAINRNYLHGSNHKTRMWISSSWINYLIWVQGWCIWLLRCRTVGTKTSETFQLLEIIINFCGGTWLSGKFTLGLGHMSRKTPEVKIGLYSPLSQLTGGLKPREGVICWKSLGTFSDHFSTITSGLDLRYYTTDKWHCSCPLVTKILVRIMTGA